MKKLLVLSAISYQLFAISFQANAQLTTTAGVTTNVSCNADNNGSATANPSGGISPYTYLWNDASSQTTATASNLVAGSYTVIVTDNSLATATASVTITQPSALQFNGGGGPAIFSYTGSLQTWAVPAGVSTATITATGASGGGAGGSINTDAGFGAQVTGIIPVSSGDILNIIVGGEGLTGTQGGGGGGGTYIWDASNSTNPLLIAGGGGGGGYFTANGAAGNGQTDVSSLPASLEIATSSVHSVAGGSNGNGGSAGNGTAYNAGGGAGWNSNGSVAGGFGTANGGADPANGAAGGTATGTVPVSGGYGGGGGGNGGGGGGGGYNGGGGGTDFGAGGGAGGGGGSYCSGTVSGTPVASNTGNGSISIAYNIAAIINNNVTCYNGSDGSLSAPTVTGGTTPYTYSWSPSGGSNSTASNLSAGTYTVTVQDANGCTLTTSAIITQPNILVTTATQIALTCNSGSNGIALANPSGGTLPYTYAWSNGTSTVSTSNSTGEILSAGSYTVTVQDNCGITATATTTIASATSGTWLGGTSTDWNDPTNWCSGVPTSSTNVVIPSGTANSPTTNSGASAVCNNITINSGATLTLASSLTVSGNFSNSGTFTPNSNTVTFIGASATVNSGGASFYGIIYTGTGTLQVTGNLLTTSNSFNNSGAGTVDINGLGLTCGDLQGGGIITNSSATPTTVTTGSDNGTFTYSGIIQDGAGTISLIKNGTGALTLPSANTYSGGTTLNSGGTLNINNASAIGTGTFTINGGTIDNTSGGAITLSTNNAMSWNSSFTFTGTNNLNLGTGAVAVGSITITTSTLGSNLTVGGVMSSGNFTTKAGAGTLTLSGANLLTNSFFLNAGQLNINNAHAIGTNRFTIANGTTIDNTSGAPITLSTNNIQTWSGSFTFIGSSDLNMGTGGVSLNGSFTITTNGSNLTEKGIITGGPGRSITKAGAGTLTLGGTNNFTGGVILKAGQLNLNNTRALGSSVASRLTITPISAVSIDNTSGGAITMALAYPQTWNGSFTFIGTNPLNMGTGAVTIATTSPTITVNSSTLTEGGIISGAFSITKAGAGALVLSGTNTFTGGVNLNAGQLNINNAKALGSGAGPFTIANGTTIDNTSAGAITLTNNNAQTWNGSFTFVGTQNLNMGTGAITLGASPTITVTANTLTEGGTINNSGQSITTAGAGTFSLGSQAVTLGSLTIGTGTFVSTSNTLNLAGNFSNSGTFTPSAVLGSGTVNFNGAAGSQVIGGTTNTQFNNASIATTGGGTVTLTSPETVTGTLTITSGNLILSGSNLTMALGATITGGSNGNCIVTNSTGSLIETYNGTGTYNFPVGDLANYTPLGLTFTSGTSGGTVSIRTSNSKEANIIASTNYLNRYWTVSQSGLGAFSCSVQGSYVAPGDVVGTETAIDNAQWTGSSFSYNGAVDNTNHQINFSGVTAFGDFTGTTSILPLTTTASVTANVICHGAATGSALSSPSGGVIPYTYLWNDASSQSTIAATGLTAGSYTVTVTDNSSATATASVTITQPNAPEVLMYASLPTCNGQSTGTGVANCFGGKQPFTYSWFNGNTTSSTGPILSAGTYTITVTDNCGLTATGIATIKPAALLGTPTIVNKGIHCMGGTGSLTGAYLGGVGPYRYAWSDANSQTTATATGLSAGSYSITIQDVCGNSASAATILKQPAPLTASNVITTAIHCIGTGNITAYTAGGTAPFTYAWNDANSQTTVTASNLLAGSYTVTLKDACGNSASAATILKQPAPLTASNAITTAIHCMGGTGNITAYTAGGTAPFTYAWNDANSQTTVTASNLLAGSYTVTLKDACGNSASAATILKQPAPLTASNAITTAIHCMGGTGNITAYTAGGTAPFTYAWNDANSQTTVTASNLLAGSYTVTLKDACGNSASATTKLTQPAVALNATWATVSCQPPTAHVVASGGIPAYSYSWSPGGATSATEPVVDESNYTVTVTDHNSCSVTTLVYTQCSGSIRPNNYKPETGLNTVQTTNISLYPNPTNGQFTIAGMDAGMIVEMYDYTGRMVTRHAATDETMQLNLSGQANGIYLIRILDNTGNLVSQQKVVKTQ